MLFAQHVVQNAGGLCSDVYHAFPMGVPLGWAAALWSLVDILRGWIARNTGSAAIEGA